MPIRINLLAEQQAAEEARRKDPVKRAIWGAAAALALALLYCLNMQWKLSSARGELARHNSEYERILDNFLSVSNSQRTLVQLRTRLESLNRFTTNRFLWANTLNALHHSANENVRIVSFTSDQKFTAQGEFVVSTNIFGMIPPNPWWKFWGKYPPVPPRAWWKFWGSPYRTNLTEQAMEFASRATNRIDLVPYQKHLKLDVVTNVTSIQYVAEVKVIRPETITEKTSFTIEARDYSRGQNAARLYEALLSAPVLRDYMTRTNCTLGQEFGTKADGAEKDVYSTGLEYKKYTIQGTFPNQIRSNE